MIPQDVGAVGHSFPKLRSYITCHYRFSDMLAIKRTGYAVVFSEKESEGQSEKFPASCCISHLLTWGSVLGILHSLSLRFHLLTVGEVRVTALAVAGTVPVRFAYA